MVQVMAQTWVNFQMNDLNRMMEIYLIYLKFSEAVIMVLEEVLVDYLVE